MRQSGSAHGVGSPQRMPDAPESSPPPPTQHTIPSSRQGARVNVRDQTVAYDSSSIHDTNDGKQQHLAAAAHALFAPCICFELALSTALQQEVRTIRRGKLGNEKCVSTQRNTIGKASRQASKSVWLSATGRLPRQSPPPLTPPANSAPAITSQIL